MRSLRACAFMHTKCAAYNDHQTGITIKFVFIVNDIEIFRQTAGTHIIFIPFAPKCNITRRKSPRIEICGEIVRASLVRFAQLDSSLEIFD